MYLSLPDTGTCPAIQQVHLDLLAQTGLDLWVTEMDVWQTDENLRADYLEDALRMYFSHPYVKGVVLWGFWTQAIVSPLKGALFDAHLNVSVWGEKGEGGGKKRGEGGRERERHTQTQTDREGSRKI